MPEGHLGKSFRTWIHQGLQKQMWRRALLAWSIALEASLETACEEEGLLLCLLYKRWAFAIFRARRERFIGSELA